MEIKSFDDYRSSKYKPILNSHSDSHLQDFLTETTREVCSVLDTEVITVEKPNKPRNIVATLFIILPKAP